MKKSFALLLVLTLAIALAACGTGTPPAASGAASTAGTSTAASVAGGNPLDYNGDGKLIVGIEIQSMQSEWHVNHAEVLKNFWEGQGADEILVSSSEMDVNKEISDVEAFIAAKCDVALIIPNSYDSISDIVQEARTSGMLVNVNCPQSVCPSDVGEMYDHYQFGRFIGDAAADWLLSKGYETGQVALDSYASYKNLMKASILPHFRPLGITLCGLKPTHIQVYYSQELLRVKGVTVIHYHAIIRKALQYAMKTDLIPSNPADKVDRPKKERYQASFYDSDEVNKLFDAVRGHKLELAVLFAAFYGLRRSEAVGLRWDAIDFEKNTITIQHTVLSYNLDGAHIIEERDTTKSKASLRTLPLVPAFREKLLRIKAQQEKYRKLCGRSYNKKFLAYICVDEMGNRIRPNYISAHFGKFLAKNGLRHIRFHDLRHSCASLLLANGVPMKQIQEWMGHSDFSTTANIYAHLDYNSKLSSAEALVSGLKLDLGENENDDTSNIDDESGENSEKK